VEVDGVVDADVTVAQEHEIRLALGDRLEALPYDIWLTAEFMPRPVDDTNSATTAGAGLDDDG
jgi:hypothetical protein